MELDGTQLTDRGVLVLRRAEGGMFKVGDRVSVDSFETFNEEKDRKPATIVKIYYQEFQTGRRELADVLFDHLLEISEGHFTMFMERVV